MKLAYIDAVGGVAGDMLLAGFLSAGISKPQEFIECIIGDLGIEGVGFRLTGARRGGLHCWIAETICHTRRGAPRTFDEVKEIIERSAIHEEVKARAISVFARLASAEAAAHGVSLSSLHLHETGEADAIVEIVGTIAAVRELGLERIISSPLPMSRGSILCSHGRIPLPSPAVVQMLEGVAIRGTDIEGETVTPTGMAIVKELAASFGPMPPMTVEKAGIGGGSREGGSIPNIVRIFTGRGNPAAVPYYPSSEKNLLIETNIDDMPPLLFEHIFERLFELGALDVFLTPIVMKRGRPAHKLSILAEPTTVEPLLRVVFAESTSTGARVTEVMKTAIPRRSIEVDTQWGPISVKVSGSEEGPLWASPEFEACRQAASRHSVPVKRVIEDATAAALARIKR